MERLIVIDTETTGLNPEAGDRIVEVGAVEIIDRSLTGREMQMFVDPECDVPEEAQAVHGLSRDDLIDLGGGQTFEDIAEAIFSFIGQDRLVIHNAAFDLSFLEKEFSSTRFDVSSYREGAIDTLRLAADLLPGKRHTLDALARHFGVDSRSRDLHGALLDARILADVYLEMTTHQTSLHLSGLGSASEVPTETADTLNGGFGTQLPWFTPSQKQIRSHEDFVRRILAPSAQA